MDRTRESVNRAIALTRLRRATYNTPSNSATLQPGCRQQPMAMPDSESRQPAVSIETHGCKLNQADSAALAAEFLEAGYRLASPGESADVCVVNTCTVTHVADRKARQALRSARRRNPQATVVATGCYAQRSPQDLKGLDQVDLVLGNTQKSGLVSLVGDWRDDTPAPCAAGSDAPLAGLSLVRTRAAVKIQEGMQIRPTVPTASSPKYAAGSAAYRLAGSSLRSNAILPTATRRSSSPARNSARTASTWRGLTSKAWSLGFSMRPDWPV